MALEVEDGTAKSDAESYATVDAADTLLSLRGYTLWATMSVPEREQALRRATAYMEQIYRMRWLGTRYTTAQALSWPRLNVARVDFVATTETESAYGTDEVPREVVEACILYAYRAAAGELAPDLTRTTVREKLGPMEVEYKQGQQELPNYRAIGNLLRPLLKYAGGVIR